MYNKYTVYSWRRHMRWSYDFMHRSSKFRGNRTIWRCRAEKTFLEDGVRPMACGFAKFWCKLLPKWRPSDVSVCVMHKYTDRLQGSRRSNDKNTTTTGIKLLLTYFLTWGREITAEISAFVEVVLAVAVAVTGDTCRYAHSRPTPDITRPTWRRHFTYTCSRNVNT